MSKENPGIRVKIIFFLWQIHQRRHFSIQNCYHLIATSLSWVLLFFLAKAIISEKYFIDFCLFFALRNKVKYTNCPLKFLYREKRKSILIKKRSKRPQPFFSFSLYWIFFFRMSENLTIKLKWIRGWIYITSKRGIKL